MFQILLGFLLNCNFLWQNYFWFFEIEEKLRTYLFWPIRNNLKSAKSLLIKNQECKYLRKELIQYTYLLDHFCHKERVSHNYLDWAKYQNRHSPKSIWVIRLSFCQNYPLIRESFWQNTSLVTHMLFELCLFWYLAQSK